MYESIIMDNLMSELEALTSSPLYYVATVLGLISTALLFVYMYCTAKHKNQKLGIGWYICGYLFPLITAIVFIKKSKRFPGPGMKVCPACGDKYPKIYEVCGRCLAPLPEITEEENNKNQKISKFSGIGFWVSYVAATAVSLACVVMIGTALFNAIDGIADIFSESRIGIVNESGDTVYYDKKGNSYENYEDVVFYGKNGEEYRYTTEIATEDGFEYENELLVDSNGKKYDYYNCYVNEDGWFVYDKNEEFLISESNHNENDDPFVYDEEADKYFKPDGTEMSTEEVIEYYSAQALNYKYYDQPYCDSDGNIYYWVAEASWNEKGELITAENDPTVE